MTRSVGVSWKSRVVFAPLRVPSADDRDPQEKLFTKFSGPYIHKAPFAPTEYSSLIELFLPTDSGG